MGLGVFMKAFNASYFGNKLDFYFEFLPQIILLLSLFGWMDWLIIAKWTTDFTNVEYEAPAIISTMIDMFLNGAAIPPGVRAIVGTASTQTSLSILLLVVALLCAPLMLLPKPLILKKEMEAHAHAAEHDDIHNKKSVPLEEKPFDHEALPLVPNATPAHEELVQQVEYQKHHQDDDWRTKQNSHLVSSLKMKDLLSKEPQSEVSHGAFADIMIHQLIETIEFVLGTISNTASYLRLWALSLAHGQLAAVFLENTILPALEAHSVGVTFFGVWIGYFLWVSFTVGVLMSMDVMECFLHTLRLHWVEFQNKFYKGQGYKFTALNYDQSLKSYVR